MQRLGSAIADRWLGTVVPSWLHFNLLPFLLIGGAIRWWNAPDASWLVLLAFLVTVLVQLGAPRFGCLLGVGCGVLAVVVERDGETLFAWIVLAVACLVLLVWREVARFRQRALGLGDGWSIRVAFDEEERLALFTDDDRQPRLVAFVEVDNPPELEDALAAAPDDDELKERITAAYLRRFKGTAVLTGDLVEGTRPEIVTDAGTLRASGRLRARRKRETFEPLPEVETPDVPAPADDVKMPRLPWRLKQGENFDRWEWVMFGGIGVVVTMKAADWIDSGKLGAYEVLTILIVPVLLMSGIDYLCRRVVVDRDGLRVRTLLVDRTIPWSRVKDVGRRSGGKVVLDLGDRTLPLRFDGEDGRPSGRQVAAVLRTLRTQAPATGADSSARLSWGVYASAVYLAAIAVAAGYFLPKL